MPEQKKSHKWLADNIVGIIMVTLLGVIGYLLDQGIKDFSNRVVKIEQKQDSTDRWMNRFIGPEGKVYNQVIENMELSKRNERDIKNHSDRITILETREGVRKEQEQSNYKTYGNHGP